MVSFISLSFWLKKMSDVDCGVFFVFGSKEDPIVISDRCVLGDKI